MDTKLAKKIAVVGCPGSGKSFVAKRLAKKLNLPLYHLDKLYWNEGWVPTPKEQFVAKQQQIMCTDGWVIEGNYNDTLLNRVQSAQLIIFLDIARPVCMWRVIKRRGKKRDDLPESLEEKFDWEFISFLKWIYDYKKTGRQTLIDLRKQYPDKFLTLTGTKQVNKFLNEIQKEDQPNELG